MNHQHAISQIQRESIFFKPPPFHLILNVWFLYKEVASSVCTSVAILFTVTRLFVRRLIFWFDDVSRFPGSTPTYLENLLADEYIGVRAVEHVIPNCSYGNHRFLKCVTNLDSFLATKLWTAPSTFAAYYALISVMFYSTIWWVVMDSVWQ